MMVKLCMPAQPLPALAKPIPVQPHHVPLPVRYVLRTGGSGRIRVEEALHFSKPPRKKKRKLDGGLTFRANTFNISQSLWKREREEQGITIKL